MTRRGYILTEAAEADLRKIIRYTRKQWGEAQVRRYITRLEQGITHVVSGKGAFKDMGALYPALRVAHCEHYYVFYLPHETSSALIVAILHERMDLIARLADRLKE